jgi:hypothetical protein
MSLEDRNIEFSKVEGELMVLSITSTSQELALQEQGETVRASSRQSRPGAVPSRWRGSKLKVSRCSTPVLLVLP